MTQYNNLSKFSSNDYKKLLQYDIGLEREFLRVTPQGALSLKPHFKTLGSSLTHPYITTDFSESQIEIVSPIFDSIDTAFCFSENIQKFVYQNIEEEYLWPFSMPCILPKTIPIATYGKSDTGLQKEIYRKGLSHRYGTPMQLISGVHTNFSFKKELLDFLFKVLGRGKSYQQFKNDIYFNVIQNFLYEGWLLSYLFGASTAFHSSYQTNVNIKSSLKNAVSLRMSRAGYFNKTLCQYDISFSDLSSYLQDLTYATQTPCKNYSTIGLVRNGERIQLNDHFFQIENEHYARIRPKPNKQIPLRPLLALKNYGVEYLEVRLLDLDPFSPIGISKKTLHFLYVFLLYCLLEESVLKDTKKYAPFFLDNQNKISLKGLSPHLKLKNIYGNISARKWSANILEKMSLIAQALDTVQKNISYTEIIHQELQKIENPTLTLAAQINQRLKSQGFIELGLDLARLHKTALLKNNLKPTQKKLFEKLSLKSFEDQKNLEEKEYFNLKGYEDLEQSTQLIIRECQKKGLKFEVIDASENLLKIQKGRKTEYIKQATITKKDTFLSYHLMKNKHNTKIILENQHLHCPKGFYLTPQDNVLDDYEKIPSKVIVVKPSKRNYGHGISFVEKTNKKELLNAVRLGFSYDSQLLLEEFVEGNEYRFLVIDNEIVAILQRDPANIIGDGISTIAFLVAKKNKNPKSFKTPKDYIRLGPIELKMLKNQALTKNSIPKKNQKIYLRTNSNISTGGDSIDVTDDMPSFFKKIALKASQAISAHICGVDMIIPDLKQNIYSIIELNYNPNIAMHYYPFKGVSRNAAEKILISLGF